MKRSRRITRAAGICPTCNGSGLVEDGKGGLKVCPTCKGTGRA